ncbi:hypothetical protein PLICRDRAFT_33015 [Plicaturopsis crispa FD-325 SS-3]|uniref:Uncharacterized protein n=1 Tax=Plicaturopsis crispa FD-325 SS-3 TaxID=944288 RepID=A0A0C9SVR4_PLICR|nr:hypothetical protein PLICRDRAFT_33015 [Plicaturopsis crispa FD-325 SS-3]
MAAPDIPTDMHLSERLVYRAWEDGDVEHVFAWMQDPVRLTKSSVRAPYPRGKKELAEHWAQRAPAALLWGFVLEGTNRKALVREGKFWDTNNMWPQIHCPGPI